MFSTNQQAIEGSDAICLVPWPVRHRGPVLERAPIPWLLEFDQSRSTKSVLF
jgi:hypothetical protein